MTEIVAPLRRTTRSPRYGRPPSVSGARWQLKSAKPRANGRTPFAWRTGSKKRGPTLYAFAGRCRVNRRPSVTVICVAQPIFAFRRALEEQHTDVRLATLLQARAGVVVEEDPPVSPAVTRVAVRAPLAHPDAVSPAVAGDDQRRRGARGARAGGASTAITAAIRSLMPGTVRARQEVRRNRARIHSVAMRRVLVANRGEIALRVFRACRAEGLETVAVAAPDDRGALHAESADALVEIASYLDPAEHVRAARESGADAVHPGYGFLSESAEFAEAVIDGRPDVDRPAACGAAGRRRQARREGDGASRRECPSCRAARRRRSASRCS